MLCRVGPWMGPIIILAQMLDKARARQYTGNSK